MSLNTIELNVSDTCIAIIATLLGAGYPLFLNLLKDVNTFYSSSLVLSELKKERAFIRFNLWLKISLFCLLIWSFNLPSMYTPKSEVANFIINNSAKILLLLSTILLVTNFILFIKESFKYYQPHETAKKLIIKYKQNI